MARLLGLLGDGLYFDGASEVSRAGCDDRSLTRRPVLASPYGEFPAVRVYAALLTAIFSAISSFRDPALSVLRPFS
jgi:hypothetical protein